MLELGCILLATLASHGGVAAFVEPILLLLLAILGVIALGLLFALIESRDRRERHSPGGVVCKHCGYDLRGNISGICPECGTTVPEGARQKLTNADAGG